MNAPMKITKNDFDRYFPNENIYECLQERVKSSGLFIIPSDSVLDQ